MKKKTTNNKSAESVNKGFGSVSIHDIASMVVRLEPSDLQGIVHLRDALVSLFSSSISETEKKFVAEAINKIDDLFSGNSLSAAEVISEVGRLVEEAICALDAGAGECAPKSEEKTNVSKQANEDVKKEEKWTLETDLNLLGEFITESRELIEKAEAALLELETNPEDSEAIGIVFRAFHTIKGTAAFLGLNFVSELAHKAETLLSRIRDQQIRYSGGYADLALQSVDMLKLLLQAVQDAMGGASLVKPDGYDELLNLLANPEAAGISEEPFEVEESAPRVGDILVAQGKATREEVEIIAADQGQEPIGVAILKSGTAKVSDVAKALRTQQRLKGLTQPAETTVRVRTDRLDRLIDMIGELVIAHSMVAQDEVVNSSDNGSLLRKVSHVSKIVRELQDISMSMRMVPFKGTFQKMARLVRDLAHKSGKQVNFVFEGEDTEIDRNMVDMLNDPLVHMLRNAIDHGIEPAEERVSKGKPTAGTVRLSAYHAGSSVVLEVSDDGRGLDREKIFKKAVERGLVEPDKKPSDRELFALIFEAGFSTADKVTEVSGRGVGMDVVKKAVEALRGSIEISSEPNVGTTFIIRLPLTMAITDGMLVKVGDQRYILPTSSILLALKPDEESIFTVSGKGEMLLFRDELIPIYRLHRIFGLKDAIEDITKGLLVLIGDSINKFAILVDELLGQQQVVAKSLGDGVGKIQGISGGAILGDGRVGLILDPQGIVASEKASASIGA